MLALVLLVLAAVRLALIALPQQAVRESLSGVKPMVIGADGVVSQVSQPRGVIPGDPQEGRKHHYPRVLDIPRGFLAHYQDIITNNGVNSVREVDDLDYPNCRFYDPEQPGPPAPDRIAEYASLTNMEQRVAYLADLLHLAPYPTALPLSVERALPLSELPE